MIKKGHKVFIEAFFIVIINIAFCFSGFETYVIKEVNYLITGCDMDGYVVAKEVLDNRYIYTMTMSNCKGADTTIKTNPIKMDLEIGNTVRVRTYTKDYKPLLYGKFNWLSFVLVAVMWIYFLALIPYILWQGLRGL